MKINKLVFTTLLTILLISCNSIITWAMNSGFTMQPISNEEKSIFKSNVDVSVLESELIGNTIECFDVSDDGMIAIGSSDSGQKTISVYDSQGMFQYGYKFNCSGSFGVEWDDNNIIIYFVRSDVACMINSIGEIEEVLKIEDTLANNSYWNNFVFSNTRTIGNVEYIIQNDIGILNVFSTSYSQLVILGSNGETKIIYDVNSQQLFNLVMFFLCVLFFAFIVCFSLRKTVKSITQSGDAQSE